MWCAFLKREQSPLASRGASWRSVRSPPPSAWLPRRRQQAAADRYLLVKLRRGLGTGSPTGSHRGAESPKLASARRLRPLKLVEPARPAASQAAYLWWQRTATGNRKRFIDATAGHGGGNEQGNSRREQTLAQEGRVGSPVCTRRGTWEGRRGGGRSAPPGLLPRQRQAQSVEDRRVPAVRPSENRGSLQCWRFRRTVITEYIISRNTFGRRHDCLRSSHVLPPPNTGAELPLATAL